MVDVWLPYDKTEVCAHVPARNLLGVIEPKEKLGINDVAKEIVQALREPIGSKPLSQIVTHRDKVAIVVDDVTRATPSRSMVLPLLNELSEAGVRDEAVTIIFACGTHRSVKPEEAEAILGEDVVTRIKVVSHACDSNDHVYVGTTPKHGTRVLVNRLFHEADVKILTGDIEFHYYAGFGGGRKSVLPGVTGVETIRKNHAMILHPKARTGVLDGNPIHEDMIDAAKLAGVDFILNVVTNSRGEVVQAFAGDLEQAFYQGVQLVEELYSVSVDRRSDILIVSPGGSPADMDLYQAYKAVDNCLDCVKRGGVIILVAECSEGHGNSEFFTWMKRFKDEKLMEKQIKKRFQVGGHKAYYLLKALRKVQIILVSTMPDYYAVNVFRLRTARTLNDALRDAFNLTKSGKNAKVWVVPHGHTTMVSVNSQIS